MASLNKTNYTLMISNFFILFICAITVEGETRMTKKETECNNNIQKLCSCPKSESINCARVFISSLIKFDVEIDYLKQFYFEFFYNLDTADIENPAKFCENKDSICRNFLKPFGNSSLTAAQYALYETKFDSIVQKDSKGRLIMQEACQKQCNIQEKFKRQFGNQYGSPFNKQDVQKEYLMHIMDKIKLTRNQKSPSKFCKDKFNPDPDYIEEHEELFELNNLHF